MKDVTIGLGLIVAFFAAVFGVATCQQHEAAQARKDFLQCVRFRNDYDADYAYFPPQLEERRVVETSSADLAAEYCFDEYR